jgi:hypothetical protein
VKKRIEKIILAHDGKVVKKELRYIEAFFPKQKIEQAVKVFVRVTDKFNQKAILYGGSRLFVYIR